MTSHLPKGFLLEDLAHPRDLLELLSLLRSIETMATWTQLVSHRLALCSLPSRVFASRSRASQAGGHAYVPGTWEAKT